MKKNSVNFNKRTYEIKMIQKEKILVFIPMFNCEKQIKRVISQFSNEIQEFFEEIIIIDNRSNDKSIEVAKNALAQNIKNCKASIFRNKENYNLGGSIKVAFKYAIDNNFDYMITLHGDAQSNIKDVIPVIKTGQHRKVDMCIGARFHRESALEGYSWFRTFGNKTFNFLCSVITLRKIDDLIAGLNIYSVNFIKEICPVCLGFPNNLTFDVHCLMYMLKNKKDFIYFPLVWKEEDQVSNAKIFKQAFTVLKLFSRFVLNKKSLFKITDEDIALNQLEKNYKNEVIYQNF
jgi:glycosyltransferase involved in cell wall biosynthesis